MPVNHRFLEHDFGNGFQTHNAILDTTPYEPEMLILGTYNPGTNCPGADFFYGRKKSWFWVVMKNLCVNGPNNQQLTQRIPVGNNQLIGPELSEILTIAEKVKITFADLIKGVMHIGNPQYVVHDNPPDPKDKITYQGVQYDLISDNGLASLNNLGQINWATQGIIKYIQRTPSVTCVRFTRKPDYVWQQHWDQIRYADYGDREINFGRIHTPAGMGLMEAGVNPAKALARRWLWHGDSKRRFCEDWIEKYVIDPAVFNYLDHAHRLNG
jgi:hypothetical protein